jgi:hypothetical protein
MDDPAHSTSHNHFAGRTPAGSQQAITLGKNGVKHVSESREEEKVGIHSIGAGEIDLTKF